MPKRLGTLKSAFMGLVLIGSLVASAPAAASGTPTLTNSGSGLYSVHIHGENFTPNGWVHVDVTDPYSGSSFSSGWVRASDVWCMFFYCFGGGSFDYSDSVSPACPLLVRQAGAYDVESGTWSNVLTFYCV